MKINNSRQRHRRFKNRKIVRFLAAFLALLMFATSNGSFLVWGMSEGRLNFLGTPVAEAKIIETAEAKIVENAQAITVEEIMNDSRSDERHWWEFWRKKTTEKDGNKKRKSIFSDSETELVAREILGDRTVDVLNEDVLAVENQNGMDAGMINNEEVKNNSEVNEDSDGIDKDVMDKIEVIDLSEEDSVDGADKKQRGFFQKIWTSFVEIFNKSIKTSILEGAGRQSVGNDADTIGIAMVNEARQKIARGVMDGWFPSGLLSQVPQVFPAGNLPNSLSAAKNLADFFSGKGKNNSQKNNKKKNPKLVVRASNPQEAAKKAGVDMTPATYTKKQGEYTIIYNGKEPVASVRKGSSSKYEVTVFNGNNNKLQPLPKEKPWQNPDKNPTADTLSNTDKYENIELNRVEKITGKDGKPYLIGYDKNGKAVLSAPMYKIAGKNETIENLGKIAVRGLSIIWMNSPWGVMSLLVDPEVHEVAGDIKRNWLDDDTHNFIYQVVTFQNDNPEEYSKARKLLKEASKNNTSRVVSVTPLDEETYQPIGQKNALNRYVKEGDRILRNPDGTVVVVNGEGELRLSVTPSGEVVFPSSMATKNKGIGLAKPEYNMITVAALGGALQRKGILPTGMLSVERVLAAWNNLSKKQQKQIAGEVKEFLEDPAKFENIIPDIFGDVNNHLKDAKKELEKITKEIENALYEAKKWLGAEGDDEEKNKGIYHEEEIDKIPVSTDKRPELLQITPTGTKQKVQKISLQPGVDYAYNPETGTYEECGAIGSFFSVFSGCKPAESYAHNPGVVIADNTNQPQASLEVQPVEEIPVSTEKRPELLQITPTGTKQKVQKISLQPGVDYAYNPETGTYEECGAIGSFFSVFSGCKPAESYAHNPGVVIADNTNQPQASLEVQPVEEIPVLRDNKKQRPEELPQVPVKLGSQPPNYTGFEAYQLSKQELQRVKDQHGAIINGKTYYVVNNPSNPNGITLKSLDGTVVEYDPDGTQSGNYSDKKNNLWISPDTFVDKEGNLTKDAKDNGYVLRNGQVVKKSEIQKLYADKKYYRTGNGQYEECSWYDFWRGCHKGDEWAKSDPTRVDVVGIDDGDKSARLGSESGKEIPVSTEKRPELPQITPTGRRQEVQNISLQPGVDYAYNPETGTYEECGAIGSFFSVFSGCKPAESYAHNPGVVIADNTNQPQASLEVQPEKEIPVLRDNKKQRLEELPQVPVKLGSQPPNYTGFEAYQLSKQELQRVKDQHGAIINGKTYYVVNNPSNPNGITLKSSDGTVIEYDTNGKQVGNYSDGNNTSDDLMALTEGNQLKSSDDSENFSKEDLQIIDNNDDFTDNYGNADVDVSSEGQFSGDREIETTRYYYEDDYGEKTFLDPDKQYRSDGDGYVECDDNEITYGADCYYPQNLPGIQMVGKNQGANAPPEGNQLIDNNDDFTDNYGNADVDVSSEGQFSGDREIETIRYYYEDDYGEKTFLDPDKQYRSDGDGYIECDDNEITYSTDCYHPQNLPGIQMVGKNQGANAPPEGNQLKSSDDSENFSKEDSQLNDLGFGVFAEKALLPGMESGGRRALQILASGGSHNEALNAILEDVIRSTSLYLATEYFGSTDEDGVKRLSWLEQGVANAMAGLITAYAVDDTDGMIEATSNLVFQASIHALEEVGLLDQYDIKDKSTLAGAMVGYLGNGIRDFVNDLVQGKDLESALKHGLSTVAVGYIDNVAIPIIAPKIWEGSGDIATDPIAGGVSAGFSSAARQLLAGNKIDIEVLAKDIAQQAFTSYATKLVGDYAYQAAYQVAIENNLSKAAADAAAQNASTQAVSNYGWMIALAATALRMVADGKFDAKGIVISGASIAAGAAAGATYGSVVPGIGTVVGAVVGVVLSMVTADKPKDYEIADWKAITQEAVRPNLLIDGLDGRSINAIASTAVSGDTAKAKTMMREALNNTALGKISQMAGLSGLFESALALANDSITRIRDDFTPGSLEADKSDNIKTGNLFLDAYTNRYTELKKKLKDCYIRNDQKCVSETAQKLRRARNSLITVAVNKFNEKIAHINKEIHELEMQLSKAKTAKEKAEIEAKLKEAGGRRDLIRQARDQYQNIAHSCPPGKIWHVVDHYCIDESKVAAHCTNGGGSWRGVVKGCVCDKKPGGHWMGDHCEYGFNEQQEQQLRLNDAADNCRHRLGNWKWDGHNCVEIDPMEAKKRDCLKRRDVYREDVDWNGRECVQLGD